MITDLASEQQISSSTNELSVLGFFVLTPTPSSLGVKVRITFVHAGAKVVAFSHVVYVRADGTGIAFINIEPDDQATLER